MSPAKQRNAGSSQRKDDRGGSRRVAGLDWEIWPAPQDRLIKKMRRKKIASYEAANEYLETQYLPDHNRRFARPAAKPEDDRGRKPSARELRQISAWRPSARSATTGRSGTKAVICHCSPGQRR